MRDFHHHRKGCALKLTVSETVGRVYPSRLHSTVKDEGAGMEECARPTILRLVFERATWRLDDRGAVQQPSIVDIIEKQKQ